MIESTALATMDDISAYCREVKLPCSEAKILQMHKEEGFPLKQLAGQWESDKTLITAWRQERLLQRRIDTSYIEERNQFIPTAEKLADRKHGATPPRSSDKKSAEKWAADWTLTFHTEMERLWEAHAKMKRIAAAYAQEEAKRIYEEKLAELMGSPAEA